MPVLLTAEQAPSLRQLLSFLAEQGVEVELVSATAAELKIQGIGSLQQAGGTELSFLSNPQLQDQLLACKAAVVVMAPADYENLQAKDKITYEFAIALYEQPYLVYALLAQWFDQHRVEALNRGIHSTAVIDPTATLATDVHIGPHAIIEAGVCIGTGTRIGAGSVVGANTVIGQNVLLHANVTLYHQVTVGDRAILHSGCVIGADGFGFAPHPAGGWAKIAQLGTVEIGADVEIGANTTIDCGALDATVIADGVKIDNQVMVGHNCHIGEHTAIAGCVGIAGSTHIGARCIVGGAAMFSGHLHITDDVQISGGTAVTSSIKKPGRYSGVYPYAEHKDWQYNAAVISQLSQLRKRLRALERHSDASITKS